LVAEETASEKIDWRGSFYNGPGPGGPVATRASRVGPCQGYGRRRPMFAMEGAGLCGRESGRHRLDHASRDRRPPANLVIGMFRAGGGREALSMNQATLQRPSGTRGSSSRFEGRRGASGKVPRRSRQLAEASLPRQSCRTIVTREAGWLAGRGDHGGTLVLSGMGQAAWNPMPRRCCSQPAPRRSRFATVIQAPRLSQGNMGAVRPPSRIRPRALPRGRLGAGRAPGRAPTPMQAASTIGRSQAPT